MRIGRPRHGAEYGHTRNPLPDHIGRIVCVDATDRAERHPRPTIQQPSDFRQSREADGRGRLLLAGGGKDTSDADVIDQFERRRLGLGPAAHGEPNDGLLSQQTTRIGRRHVLLTQVNTLGAGRQGDVDPVIDQKRHTEGLEARVQRARKLHGLMRTRPLVAELKQAGAAHCGLDRGLEQSLRSDLSRIENDV